MKLTVLFSSLLSLGSSYLVSQFQGAGRWRATGSIKYSCVLCGQSADSDVEPLSPKLRITQQSQQKSALLLLTSLGLLLDARVAKADIEEQEQAKVNADFVQRLQDTRDLNSDEYVISFVQENLKLRLNEEGYKGFPIVTVSGILDTDLVVNHKELRIGAVVIQVGDQKCEGLPLVKIADIIKNAERPLSIKFRDPSRYFELLDSSTPGSVAKIITSSYLPANTRELGLPEQLIRVEREAMPPPDERTRSAVLLDVIEIQYVAALANGTIIDSSASRCPPGSSSKTIYYVLGQRNGPPVGKGEVPFPPGWDLTLRGMVVGEQRRITLPTTLAFYTKKLEGIPQFSPIIYTVKLVSIT